MKTQMTTMEVLNKVTQELTVRATMHPTYKTLLSNSGSMDKDDLTQQICVIALNSMYAGVTESDYLKFEQSVWSQLCTWMNTELSRLQRKCPAHFYHIAEDPEAVMAHRLADAEFRKQLHRILTPTEFELLDLMSGLNDGCPVEPDEFQTYAVTLGLTGDDAERLRRVAVAKVICFIRGR